MIKRLFLCLFVMLLFTEFVYSRIIITKDKNGNTVFSNVTEKSVRQRRSFNLKKRTHRSSSFSIPLKYKAKIERLSSLYGVDFKLIAAVIRAESSFNPYAVSSKGAVGLMQLMPETAKIYGVTDRYDVDQNLKAGVKYLKYLRKKYKSVKLTLAAYNAGETAVLKYGGVPPYKETKNYIRKIMGFLGLAFSSGYSRPKSKIYKYTNADGTTVISDNAPTGKFINLEIID